MGGGEDTASTLFEHQRRTRRGQTRGPAEIPPGLGLADADAPVPAELEEGMGLKDPQVGLGIGIDPPSAEYVALR
jgi:hypothetical protein